VSSSPRYNSRPNLSRLSANARRTYPSQRRRDLVHSVSVSLRNSQYHRAFKQIIASGPAARRAFDKIVKRQIKRQMAEYFRDGALDFPKFTDSKSVMSFCWTDVVAQLSKSLPTLYAALSGSMPQKLTNSNGQMTYVVRILFSS